MVDVDVRPDTLAADTRLALNVFTSGFHGAVSSTGRGTPRRVRWVYGEQEWDGITLFEDGWMFHPDAAAVKSRVRLGWLVEPRALRPENYARAPDVASQYDAILTYDARLLASDRAKYVLCPRMGVHVPEAEWGLRPKARSVALMATTKASTFGHQLRKDAAAMFGAEVDVYGQDAWADKVQALAPYRFAVVIEAERAPNLFTDHLLDVIALGCVPLYWGAPNIAAYLDGAGILAWRTLDDLAHILESIKVGGEQMCAAMRRAARRNLARLPRYRLAEDWLAENVLGRWA